MRHPRADSPNSGWRNLSFRGYADYMQSPEFNENVAEVAELARTERCVLMCAEAVPWRCHRSMIGDALLVRGLRVEDIIHADGDIRQEFGSGLLVTMDDAVFAVVGPVER